MTRKRRTAPPPAVPDVAVLGGIPAHGPLSPAQSMALCSGCVRCCTYVAIEVDAPDLPWMYDQYVWLLYHENIWMYVQKGNRWFVQVETRCGRLSPQGHCTVHGRHPVLCKDYDPRDCERRGEVSDVVARFLDGDELLAWLQKKRPAHFRRYRAWFEKQHRPKTYDHAPAQVRDQGAARRGNLAKGGPAIPLASYTLPPPPASPLPERGKRGR